jgi:hypothetical protein
MSDQLQPLAEREYVDLDTGLRVVRGARSRSCMFQVKDEAEGESVTLEDVEIRQLAELAGYEVTEGDR